MDEIDANKELTEDIFMTLEELRFLIRDNFDLYFMIHFSDKVPEKIVSYYDEILLKIMNSIFNNLLILFYVKVKQGRRYERVTDITDDLYEYAYNLIVFSEEFNVKYRNLLEMNAFRDSNYQVISDDGDFITDNKRRYYISRIRRVIRNGKWINTSSGYDVF